MVSSERPRPSKATRRCAGFLAAAVLATAMPARCGLTYGWERTVAVPGLGNPLVLNPQNPNTCYGAGFSGADGSILVSRDRGDSWQTLAVVAGGANIKQVLVLPSDSLTMLAAQEAAPADRIMKSTDGGATWSETFSGDFSYFGVPVEADPAHPETLYTMSGTALYRSTDFGSGWSLVNAATGFNAWCDAALRPDSAGVIYVGDATSGIWKTTDAGATFRNVCPTSGEIPMIAIDPADPAVAYATRYAGGGGFLKTTDFGETWQPLPEFAGMNTWGVAIAPRQPQVILMGVFEPGNTALGTFLSLDAGSSWIPITCGLRTNSTYGLLAMDSTSALLLQSDGIYTLRTADSAALPRRAIRGVVRDSLGPRRARVRLSMLPSCWSLSLSQQTDSAGRFAFEGLLPTLPPFDTGYAIDVDPELPCAHLRMAVAHLDSTDVELTATVARADLFLAGEDSADYLAYYTSALDSLGLRYNVWNTALSGAPPAGAGSLVGKRMMVFFTGTQQTPLGAAVLEGLASALDSGVGLFLTGQNLAEENDTSQPFSGALGLQWGGNTLASFVQGTDLFGGISFFTSVGDGAHNQSSRDVLAAGGRGTRVLDYWDGVTAAPAAFRFDSAGPGGSRVVVAGFGFESIDGPAVRARVMNTIIGYLDGTGTEDVRAPAGVPPSRPELAQNYPNPFNPSTRLRFLMPETGVADLRVYDMLGREVAVLVHAVLPPGEHEQKWDAPGLAGGVYLARLSVGSSQVVRRMLLVR